MTRGGCWGVKPKGDFPSMLCVGGVGQSLSPPISSKLKFPMFENSVLIHLGSLALTGEQRPHG